MKENRFVLPLIIILLIFFLPCAIYGLYNKIVFASTEGNPEHLHKLDNKLYYYDNKNELIAIYECENSNCDDAQSVIDDKYLKYFEGNNNTFDIFADDYVFIQDGDIINLYNLKTKFTIAKYSQIKNYGTTIGEGYVIVKNEDGYGLFNLNALNFVINPKYIFMGINEKYISLNREKQKYAVEDNNGSYIINIADEALTEPVSLPIYDYNDDYVVYFDTIKEYTIYNYDNNKLLPNESINKVDLFDDYLVISTFEGKVYIFNNESTEAIHEFSEEGIILTYEINDNNVEIFNGMQLIERFSLESNYLDV